jgi:hypothetical protein
MKKLIVVALVLALAAIAAGAQAPPQETAQPQVQQPSAAQPQATQPPAKDQAPPAASPGIAQARPTGTKAPADDPADRQVSGLSMKLKLTEDQKVKAKAIFKEEAAARKAIQDDKTLDQKQKMAKQKEAYLASHEKLKTILTPEQLKRFDARGGTVNPTATKPAAKAPAQNIPPPPAPADPAKPAGG